MRVILLNTPQEKTSITRDMAGGLGFDATKATLLPPLDLAILAATLKKEKHQVKIIDSETGSLSFNEVIEKILEWKPAIVIANVSLPSLRDDIAFLGKLRKVFSGRVIAKTAITYKPSLKEILARSRTDFCLLGEADLEIGKIIKGKSKKGTAWLENGKLKIYASLFVENLNLLPLPARDLLKNQIYRYPLLGNNCTIMQTSRGCPFPCAYYCPYPLVQGKKWRAMSPERVYRELVDVVRRYKIDNVLFRDATFTLDRQRTVEICQRIIQNKLKFSWWCETRVNCLDRELLTVMKKAGCQGINIGVETGGPKVMEIQGKPGVSLAKLEKIKKAADWTGIKLHFLLLIGLPAETRKSLYQTFKLIKRLKPYSLGVTVITPYPGTLLWEEAKNKGWIETKDWSAYSGNLPTMHTDNLKSWEMKLAQKLIQGESFLLKKGLWGKIGLLVEQSLFKIWSFL